MDKPSRVVKTTTKSTTAPSNWEKISVLAICEETKRFEFDAFWKVIGNA